MSRYFLVRVSIEGFRGINNEGTPLVLTFKPRSVNSVFARNGLGKSSVFDALAYAIHGVIPKFQDFHASERAETYYVNRFHSAQKATIELSFLPDDGAPEIGIRVELTTSGNRTISSHTNHPDPSGFLRTFAGDAVLLDAGTFNRFVEDTPLKRGRTFSSLLGLGRLSEFRQILETLAHPRSLRTDFDLDVLEAAQRRSLANVNAAEKRARASHLALAGVEVGQAFDAAAVASSAMTALATVPLLKEQLHGHDLATINFGDLRDLIRKTEGGESRDRLAVVLKQVAQLKGLAASPEEPEEREAITAAVVGCEHALTETRGVLFETLCTAASKFIASGAWDSVDTCPLCDSGGLEQPIAEHVAGHLTPYELARAKRVEASTLWSAAELSKRLASLDAALTPSGQPAPFSHLDRLLRDGSATAADLGSALERLDSLEELRRSQLEALENERDAIEASLPPSLVRLTEQVEHAEQLQAAIRSWTDGTEAVRKILTKLTTRARWIGFIQDAADRFATAEVALSSAKTRAIESDYQSLYAQVTSNPDVVPQLKKAAGTEDLYLRLAKFYGLADLSAATLLPESYRNALAICMFLSASSRAPTAARFMVLDDVTSSFDAGHQFHLMEVLRNRVGLPGNPDGPQVVLLSHDGLLEKYFDTMSNEAGWSNQRLQGLPPQGAVVNQSASADSLRQTATAFLGAGQVSQASPFVRQYLEFSLLRVIRKVQIPVSLDFSIRDDRKMAGNCLESIRAAVELHAAAGQLVLTEAQKSQILTILMPQLVANWINHFATGSVDSLSPYVLLGVLAAIDAFVESFRYQCQCSGSVQLRFYKSLAAKHCTC